MNFKELSELFSKVLSDRDYEILNNEHHKSEIDYRTIYFYYLESIGFHHFDVKSRILDSLAKAMVKSLKIKLVIFLGNNPKFKNDPIYINIDTKISKLFEQGENAKVTTEYLSDLFSSAASIPEQEIIAKYNSLYTAAYHSQPCYIFVQQPMLAPMVMQPAMQNNQVINYNTPEIMAENIQSSSIIKSTIENTHEEDVNTKSRIKPDKNLDKSNSPLKHLHSNSKADLNMPSYKQMLQKNSAINNNKIVLSAKDEKNIAVNSDSKQKSTKIRILHNPDEQKITTALTDEEKYNLSCSTADNLLFTDTKIKHSKQTHKSKPKQEIASSTASQNLFSSLFHDHEEEEEETNFHSETSGIIELDYSNLQLDRNIAQSSAKDDDDPFEPRITESMVIETLQQLDYKEFNLLYNKSCDTERSLLNSTFCMYFTNLNNIISKNIELAKFFAATNIKTQVYIDILKEIANSQQNITSRDVLVKCLISKLVLESKSNMGYIYKENGISNIISDDLKKVINDTVSIFKSLAKELITKIEATEFGCEINLDKYILSLNFGIPIFKALFQGVSVETIKQMVCFTSVGILKLNDKSQNLLHAAVFYRRNNPEILAMIWNKINTISSLSEDKPYYNENKIHKYLYTSYNNQEPVYFWDYILHQGYYSQKTIQTLCYLINTQQDSTSFSDDEREKFTAFSEINQLILKVEKSRDIRKTIHWQTLRIFFGKTDLSDLLIKNCTDFIRDKSNSSRNRDIFTGELHDLNINLFKHLHNNEIISLSDHLLTAVLKSANTKNQTEKFALADYICSNVNLSKNKHKEICMTLFYHAAKNHEYISFIWMLKNNFIKIDLENNFIKTDSKNIDKIIDESGNIKILYKKAFCQLLEYYGQTTTEDIQIEIKISPEYQEIINVFKNIGFTYKDNTLYNNKSGEQSNYNNYKSLLPEKLISNIEFSLTNLDYDQYNADVLQCTSKQENETLSAIVTKHFINNTKLNGSRAALFNFFVFANINLHICLDLLGKIKSITSNNTINNQTCENYDSLTKCLAYKVYKLLHSMEYKTNYTEYNFKLSPHSEYIDNIKNELGNLGCEFMEEVEQSNSQSIINLEKYLLTFNFINIIPTMLTRKIHFKYIHQVLDYIDTGLTMNFNDQNYGVLHSIIEFMSEEYYTLLPAIWNKLRTTTEMQGSDIKLYIKSNNPDFRFIYFWDNLFIENQTNTHNNILLTTQIITFFINPSLSNESAFSEINETIIAEEKNRPLFATLYWRALQRHFSDSTNLCKLNDQTFQICIEFLRERLNSGQNLLAQLLVGINKNFYIYLINAGIIKPDIVHLLPVIEYNIFNDDFSDTDTIKHIISCINGSISIDDRTKLSHSIYKLAIEFESVNAFKWAVENNFISFNPFISQLNIMNILLLKKEKGTKIISRFSCEVIKTFLSAGEDKPEILRAISDSKLDIANIPQNSELIREFKNHGFVYNTDTGEIKREDPKAHSKLKF